MKIKTPKVYYAYADDETGAKILIMEDLNELVQAGYYFGPGNPGNWGKDLKSLCGETDENEVSNVLKAAFDEAANLHADNWQNKDLLTKKWLRCCDWIEGKGE